MQGHGIPFRQPVVSRFLNREQNDESGMDSAVGLNLLTIA
jgi:hypothetical protein